MAVEVRDGMFKTVFEGSIHRRAPPEIRALMTDAVEEADPEGDGMNFMLFGLYANWTNVFDHAANKKPLLVVTGAGDIGGLESADHALRLATARACAPNP